MAKRKLSQKQLDALARGRAKMAARRSRALVATGGTRAPARRSSSSPARRSSPRVITVRRRSSGGSGLVTLGGMNKYLGGVRGDDLVASTSLGFAVNKKRSTVETLINYAPEFLHGVGGYGIIALGAGALSHFGIARSITSPTARAASIVAANKLGTRGGFYESGQLSASLSGDDDLEGDDMDLEGLDELEGDDDVEGDDLLEGDAPAEDG
jgi:hypothetical protein